MDTDIDFESLKKHMEACEAAHIAMESTPEYKTWRDAEAVRKDACKAFHETPEYKDWKVKLREHTEKRMEWDRHSNEIIMKRELNVINSLWDKVIEEQGELENGEYDETTNAYKDWQENFVDLHGVSKRKIRE